jgi:EAL domain-containing protein (putative c-di-GMP-specific phosphodiesterase class I)/GGDEF domain-containing protein
MTDRGVIFMLAGDTAAEPLIRTVVEAGARPVAIAATPEAVIASAREHGAGLVLADLRLGDAVAELLRLADVPRLVALWSGQDIAGAVAAGVRSFAALDGPPEELRAVLDATFAGRPALAGAVAGEVVGALATRLSDPVLARERARERFAAPGALRAVFQPLVDLRTRSRFGHLALTRFTGRPDDAAADGFAEAREHGLGAELELAAARAALAHADRLPEDELLFIKLTCPTVVVPELLDVLVAGHADRVVLELTGHAREPEFYAAVERLRTHGVRFAVDETGAGFGALDHVLDLAPTFVRLAGGLTRDIHADRTRRALALAVTSFATHLGAQVIADRIENEDELLALSRLGVRYGLGFHLGRPGELPPRELAPARTPLIAEDAASGPLVWARPFARELTIPIRARRTFADAARAVLKVLSDRLGGCGLYVAHVDANASAVRIVDIEAADLPGVEPGRTFALEHALEPAVLGGRVPQLVPDASAIEADVPQALPAASGWACVPLAGPRDGASVVLTALAPEPGLLGRAELELIRDGASLLRATLLAEYGRAPGELDGALRELAWRDHATGVLNKARFHEIVEIAATGVGAANGYVVHVHFANYHALGERMGRALADLVRKDVARALALHADALDSVARVGEMTFGCILHGRRANEVEYFCRAVSDHAEAAARRRGATPELRVGAERLGLGATAADAWQAAAERALAGR